MEIFLKVAKRYTIIKDTPKHVLRRAVRLAISMERQTPKIFISWKNC